MIAARSSSCVDAYHADDGRSVHTRMRMLNYVGVLVFLLPNGGAWLTGGRNGHPKLPTKPSPVKIRRFFKGLTPSSAQHVTPQAAGARAGFPNWAHFTSTFFGDAHNTTTGKPVAYELRILELEERVLKLEGSQARAHKYAASNSRRGASDATTAGAAPVLPFGEQLLLGCAVGGALLGLLIGRFLLGKVLGGVGGAVLGVWLYNKENNYGELIRAVGKLVLYACDRLQYLWSELKYNWKAWRVYERSFKSIEKLDRDFRFSETMKMLDRQYRVSKNAEAWWKKAQAGLTQLEDGMREQVLHWQRTQRLREEQAAALMIQQELRRQQAEKQGGAYGPSTAPTPNNSWPRRGRGSGDVTQGPAPSHDAAPTSRTPYTGTSPESKGVTPKRAGSSISSSWSVGPPSASAGGHANHLAQLLQDAKLYWTHHPTGRGNTVKPTGDDLGPVARVTETEDSTSGGQAQAPLGTATP